MEEGSGTKQFTLFSKVLGENEKRVFYFHLKLEGTFWAPKYTHTHTKGFGIHSHPATHTHWASLVVQLVKNLPAMRERWFESLG